MLKFKTHCSLSKTLNNVKLFHLLDTVKHSLFPRTLFSRKFTKAHIRKNKVLANNFNERIIEEAMKNCENKVP